MGEGKPSEPGPTMGELLDLVQRQKQEIALLSSSLGAATAPSQEVGAHPAPAAYRDKNVLPLTDKILALYHTLADTLDVGAAAEDRKLIAVELYSLEVLPSTNPDVLRNVRQLRHVITDDAVMEGVVRYLRDCDPEKRQRVAQQVGLAVVNFLNEKVARRGTWSVWAKSYEEPRNLREGGRR